MVGSGVGDGGRVAGLCSDHICRFKPITYRQDASCPAPNTAFIPLAPSSRNFPMPSFRDLADDIAANGLRNPVVLLQGKILDGRNRYLACELAGVKPRFVEFQGDDPIGWVISQNLVRRHLTASQKAVVALDLLPLLEKEAKQRQRRSNEYRGNGRSATNCADRNGKGKAAETAARIVGASPRYVEMAKSIKQKAPELLDKIRLGELTVPLANQLADNEVRRTGGKRKKTRCNTEDACRVICGDCFKLIPTLADTSIELVLCSTPYAEQRKHHYAGVPETKYPDWCVKWMGLIWDKLAKDGSVLIVIDSHISDGVMADYVLKTQLALREAGWRQHRTQIWLKRDRGPLGHKFWPRHSYEEILWFSKTAKPYCDPLANGKVTEHLTMNGYAYSQLDKWKEARRKRSSESHRRDRCADQLQRKRNCSSRPFPCRFGRASDTNVLPSRRNGSGPVCRERFHARGSQAIRA